MQLKRRTARRSIRNVGTPLAAATCALLGQTAPRDAAADDLAPWSIDTSVLVYSESDGRVQDLSVNAIARKEVREDSFLDLTVALDTLTGASPNGAAPSNVVQTFTRPSGTGSYKIGAGAAPLDDTFHDSRAAFSAGWEWPVTRLTLLNVGASLSDEFDYTHTGLDAKLAHDFNDRNTTLSFGVALASDTIDPVGGAPVPLAPMLGRGNSANKRGSESKDVTDLLIGVTQVVNRKTLVQLNYSLSNSDGYLTDPYKILSVVDPVTGAPVPGPAGSGIFGYLYESRPDSRQKQSLFGLVKHDFDGSVLEASYRYMTDDWGVDSQTFDIKYRWSLKEGRYIQPHVRYYTQSAADFYHAVLFAGRPGPEFATADYRLGELDGITVGVKYGGQSRYGEWSGRLEWYRQTGNADPSARVGVLANLDLYPDLNALIAQVSYKFGHR